MYKVVVFIFLIFSLSSQAKDSICQNGNFENNKFSDSYKYDQEVCYKDFNVLYSYKSKSPVVVAEHLTSKELVHIDGVVRSNFFFADKNIPVAFRAFPIDYAGTGYDKGHQSPAGDSSDKDTKDQTFVMSNMVPQTPALNRQSWRLIEEEVRNKVNNVGAAYILTGSIYSDNPSTIKGDIWIPEYSYKAVEYADKTRVIYVAKNSKEIPTKEELNTSEFFSRFKFNPF